MQSNIFTMIKQKSDKERVEQTSLSLISRSIIARMKNAVQGMNDIK